MVDYHAPSTAYEWLVLLLRLGLAGACLRLGMWVSAHSVRARNAAAWAAGAVIAAGLAAQHRPIQYAIAPAFTFLGGERPAICLAAFLLLGIALRSRERRVRTPFIRAALAVGGAAYLTLVGSPLAWRYLGKSLRENVPDETGYFCQQRSVTCSAAAGALFLYRNGIRISEGDLAQLAGTSPIAGTTEYELYRAIARVARTRGRCALIARVTYAEAQALGQPFIAYIDHPDYGPHTVLVTRLADDKAHVFDTVPGEERPAPRADFEKQWDRVIVWIVTGSEFKVQGGSVCPRSPLP